MALLAHRARGETGWCAKINNHLGQHADMDYVRAVLHDRLGGVIISDVFNTATMFNRVNARTLRTLHCSRLIRLSIERYARYVLHSSDDRRRSSRNSYRPMAVNTSIHIYTYNNLYAFVYIITVQYWIRSDKIISVRVGLFRSRPAFWKKPRTTKTTCQYARPVIGDRRVPC